MGDQLFRMEQVECGKPKWSNWCGHRIPKRTLDALERYTLEHIRPGGFLCAVLENDLMKAVSMADDENEECLSTICKWVYCEAPQSCHGSSKIITEWVNKEI